MEQKQARYQTFILRLWVEKDPLTQASTCRFSVEDTMTGKRFGFAHLDELYAFLETTVVKLESG